MIGSGRILSTQAFGILYAGLSFINILVGPTVILSLFLARRITVAMTLHGMEAATSEFYAMVRYTFRFGLIVALCTLLLMLSLRSYLHVESSMLIVMIIVTTFAIYVTETTRGAFQGFKHFNTLGLETLSWMVLRFILGIAGILLIGSVWGGFLGICLAAVMIFGIFYFVITRRTNARVSYATTWNVQELKKLGLFSFSFALFMGLMYSDVIMAYFGLNRFDLGIYSSASVLTKAIIVVTTPIIQVFFPVMVEQKASGGQLKIAQAVKSLGTTLVISVSLATVICIFPDYLAKYILGAKHYDVQVIQAIALSAIPLSVVRVFVVFQLARGRDKHPMYLLPMLIIQVVLLHIFNGSLREFAWTFAIFCWVIMVYYALLSTPKELLKGIGNRLMGQDVAVG